MGAAPASHFFTMIMSLINTGLATYTDEVAGRVISDICVPAARNMWIILFCMWGFMVMRGAIQSPVVDGVFRFLRVAVLIWLMEIGRYSSFVADFFLTAPDQIAVVIAGPSAGTDSISFLDNLWTKLYAFGDAYWKQGTVLSASGFGFILIAGVVWLVGLLATGGAFVLIVIAKLGIHIWLAVGPVFILLSMYEATKQFLNSWLGQLVSFALVTVLTAAVIKLILSICELYLGQVAPGGVLADPTINKIFPALLVCGLALVLFWQMPSFASGLGGGVAISTLGILAAGYLATKGVFGGAAGSAKNVLSGKTLSDARAHRRQKATNAKWADKNPGLSMRTFRSLTSGKNKMTKA